MTVSVPSRAPRIDAQQVEALRRRYEDRGFSFIVHPPQELVPEFLWPFEPDAIARGPGSNIVVEVKTRQGGHDERSVADIRRHLADHPDWTLDVAYVLGGEPRPTPIPSAEASRVRTLVREATALNAAGHARAAFLLAWSLLEASVNTASGKPGTRRTAGQVVQWLAMNGNLEVEKEPRLRALGELRDRIAHGDLSIDATADDVAFVLGAIADSLMDAAA